MAFGGREIKSFLTLDITNFTQGLSGAKSKAASLKSELNGLQKGASGSNSEVSKLKQNSDGLNQTMNNLSQTTSKTGKELENTAKSTSNAGNNATTAQSKMHGLNNAMNLLKATAGMLAITLLKSDYFRIEMLMTDFWNLLVSGLKSDYFRIEICSSLWSLGLLGC